MHALTILLAVFAGSSSSSLHLACACGASFRHRWTYIRSENTTGGFSGALPFSFHLLFPFFCSIWFSLPSPSSSARTQRTPACTSSFSHARIDQTSESSLRTSAPFLQMHAQVTPSFTVCTDPRFDCIGAARSPEPKPEGAVFPSEPVKTIHHVPIRDLRLPGRAASLQAVVGLLWTDRVQPATKANLQTSNGTKAQT